MFKALIHHIRKLSDPRFLDSITETRKRHQFFTYVLLGFIQPFYIFIDRSMFPDLWYQWNFLGIRVLVSGATLLLMLKPAWRESRRLFYIPSTALFMGIPIMLNSYPFHQLTEGYQGATLVMLGYALVACLPLKEYVLYLTAIYLFSFQIWLFNPPSSMKDWMIDGGFSNYSVSFVVAIAFYWFKLNLWHRNFFLMEKLKSVSEKFEHQARDVRSILEHIPQGVCLIQFADDGRTLVLDEHQSLSFSRFVEIKPHEDTIQSLFKRTDLTADSVDNIRWIMTSSLHEEMLQWNLNVHNLPHEFRAQGDQGWRPIEVDWNAVPDAEGRVRKILVLFKDVGELRQLQNDVAQRNEDARRLAEIIRNKAETLEKFFRYAESTLNDAGTRPIHKTFRDVHTLKGMARGYQLKEIVTSLHALESKMGAVQALPLHQLEEFLQLEGSLRHYRSLFEKLYGDKDAHHALPQQVSLKTLLNDEIVMLEQLAQELRKPVPDVQISGPLLELDDKEKFVVRKVFVHMFRNSMDHGLEDAMERQARKKPIQGRVSVQITRDGSSFRLEYTDDGRGLCLPRIHQRAISLGLVSADDPVSPESVAGCIFQPSLTTAAVISDISGRGIGLDAVRSFLEEIGGTIELRLGAATADGNYPITFIMTLEPVSRHPALGVSGGF